jgi:hypothetical protein
MDERASTVVERSTPLVYRSAWKTTRAWTGITRQKERVDA